MSALIKILQERSSSGERDLDGKLHILAKKIVTETEEHQKRVLKIMPEYDLHDNVHLIKVEQNIVALIGSTLLQELSSLEIFPHSSKVLIILSYAAYNLFLSSLNCFCV